MAGFIFLKTEERSFFAESGNSSGVVAFDVSYYNLTIDFEARIIPVSPLGGVHFEISLDGSIFSDLISVPRGGGNGIARLYVRMKSTAPTGVVKATLRVEIPTAQDNASLEGTVIKLSDYTDHQKWKPTWAPTTITETFVVQNSSTSLIEGRCNHFAPFNFPFKNSSGLNLTALTLEPGYTLPSWAEIDYAGGRIYNPAGRSALDTLAVGLYRDSPSLLPTLKFRAYNGTSFITFFFRIAVRMAFAEVRYRTPFRKFTGSEADWPHFMYVWQSNNWVVSNNAHTYPLTRSFYDPDRVSITENSGSSIFPGSTSVSWSGSDPAKIPLSAGRYAVLVRGSYSFVLRNRSESFSTNVRALYQNDAVFEIGAAPRVEPDQIFSLVKNQESSIQPKLIDSSAVARHWVYKDLPEGLYWDFTNGRIFGVPKISDVYTVQAKVYGKNVYEPEESTNITIVVSDTPPATLTASVSELRDFLSSQGFPSPSKSLTISGSNVTSSISVSAGPGFEVSLNNSSFSPSVTFTPQNESPFSTTIHARLTDEAPLGSQTSTISISASGAPNRTVNLFGEVLPAQFRPVTFFVNMSIMAGLGRFSLEFDKVEVRGPFNNWQGTELSDADGDGIYSGTIIIEGQFGAPMEFKFFVPANSLSWEDGPNRTFTLGSPDTAQILDVLYFNNISTLPPVLVGTSQVVSLYVGVNAVTRMHLGDTQIFP
jgi:hypothetical protein